MTNLLLHIGFPKTGTTAIQKTLIAHRESLQNNGILYPQTGRWLDGSHHGLGFALMEEQQYGLVNVKSLDELLQDLKHEIRQSKNVQNVLISTEAIQSIVWKPQLSNLKKLCALFDTTHIICGLRRQDVLLDSLFKQNVKDPVQRYSMSTDDYFDNQGHWFDYQKILTQWSTFFDMGHIHPFPYHGRKNSNNISVFSSEVSKIVGNSILLENCEEHNLSLNGEGLEVKWVLNSRIADLRRNGLLLDFLFTAVNCREPRHILKPWQRLKVLDGKFQSNNWLYRTFPRSDWNLFANQDIRGQLLRPPSRERQADILMRFEAWETV